MKVCSVYMKDIGKEYIYPVIANEKKKRTICNWNICLVLQMDGGWIADRLDGIVASNKFTDDWWMNWQTGGQVYWWIHGRLDGQVNRWMDAGRRMDGQIDEYLHYSREDLRVGDQQRPGWASEEKKGQTVSVTWLTCPLCSGPSLLEATLIVIGLLRVAPCCSFETLRGAEQWPRRHSCTLAPHQRSKGNLGMLSDIQPHYRAVTLHADVRGAHTPAEHNGVSDYVGQPPLLCARRRRRWRGSRAESLSWRLHAQGLF